MALTLDRQKQALQNAVGGPPPADPIERSITVNDIMNFTPAIPGNQRSLYDQVDRYNRMVPALPNSTYFPSGDNNIVKGVYSGPTIGTVSLVAPSQQMPYGIWGKRNEQLAAAAAAKAKSEEDFFKLAKPPETSRFSVQADLDQAYYDGLTQWVPVLKQRYGDNWATAYQNDIQFQQWDQSMNTVAKYNTGLVDKVAQLEALDKDPNFVLSPTTRKYANAVIAGYGGLANAPWDSQSYGLGQNLLRMNAETDLDVAVNNATKEYVDHAAGTSYYQGAQGPYDVWASIEKHGMNEEQIAMLTDTIWKNSYGGQSDYFTKEDIANRLRTIYPEVAKKTVEFQNNQYAQGTGGNDMVFEANAVNPEVAETNYGDATVGTYDAQTFTPVKLNVRNVTTAIDPKTGQPVTVAGNSTFVAGQTFNVLVDANGVPVPTSKQADAMKQMKMDPLTGNYHYETYVAGTVETGSQTTTGRKPGERATTSTTTKTTQTVWMPASTVENGLTTYNADGSYKKGVRIDIQKNNATQRTQQFKANVEQVNPVPANSTPAKQQTNTTPPSGGTITPEQFDAQWANLQPGQSLVGPDGKTYTKK